MEYKDVSPDIASVSQGYASHKFPSWWLRLQDLLQQFLLWLQDWLNAIFHQRGPGVGDNRSLSMLLQYGLYFAGAIALGVICYLLWRRAALRKETLSSTRRGAAAIDKILDSKGYRSDAERLAGLGDFKGACRALYLCLLQQMHEQQVATFAPAKTNYEYRYLLLSFPQLKSGFIQLAEIVEQIWFGNKPALTDDYAQCLHILAQASSEVERISAERANLKLDSEQ